MAKTSGLNIQVWSIDKITPYENNAKRHPKEQVAKIAKSIQEFGWDQPIVVDRAGVIIKGHGRRMAALSLGLKEVPVWVRDDLTDEQVKAARLADNRAAISDIDGELLRKELRDLEIDLTGIFDAKEMEFFTADLGTVNEDVFVENLDEEVEKQAVSTAAKVKEAKEHETPIAKALGFKSVRVRDEKYIAALIAKIESDTGKSGAEGFVEFAKGILQSA